jgi:hypothetical protein
MWFVALAILIPATPALAQDEDNSGTNPLNFTYDARWIIEMAQFKEDGGSLVTNTFEFRAPLGRDIANLGGGSLFADMGKTFGIRFRGRYNNLSVDTPGAPPFNTSSVSGIGDFDARLLGVPYASKNLIIAGGLEAFFDTASNDALGAGKSSLGPQVFFAFPGVLGGSSLFVPGYQYVFDIGGPGSASNISRSQIDLYFVWLLAGVKNWLIFNPQIILDHENSQEFTTIEGEFGYMIAQSVGASVYMRPGVGIGAARPYSWNLEIGLKFIWR